MRYSLFILAMLFSFIAVSAAESLILSKDGKTEYVIVLPAEPTAVEQTAAKELKQHLDAVTGADFVIVKESEVDGTKPQLLIGNSKRLKKLLPQLDIKKIPYDGIVIKTVGKDIIFVGHPQRGTLYAVNTFLEDAVGVRWWTSTESFIPKKPTLEVPAQNVEYAPKLIFRSTSYLDARDGVFSSRMKCNGQINRIAPEYGGRHQFFHWVHSFYPLLPPKQYFEKHPEWYSEIKGQRTHERAQLCLTNDEMRAELTKNAIEGLRKNPDAKFISVSQNDWAGYCTCEKCKAVDDEEGSRSGTLVRFVNKVAEDIEKEFPDVFVETLAYQYTRKPPKFVKPRKNVIIRLCTIECSFIQPLGEGEHNKSLREDMQGWSKIADNLFVWDYTVNFSAYMLPHPNHRVLAPNIRFFVDNNTIGLYEQGDSYCTAGDFVRMKNWVISKLMWNPSLDADKLFEEFIDGYYGPKGSPIKGYLDILHDRAEQSDVFLRCFMNSTNDWLDFETWSEAKANFRALVALSFNGKVGTNTGAMSLADYKIFSERWEREMIPLLLVLLKEFHSFQQKRAILYNDAIDSEETKEILDFFFDICKKHNVQAYREYDTPKQFEEFEADMRAKFIPAPPPEFCKDLPKTSWLEVQNAEFRSWSFGKTIFTVTDEKASNKRAVKMLDNPQRREVCYDFDNSLQDLTPIGEAKDIPQYRVYAAVRCDAKEGIEGKAMNVGVYDGKNNKSVTLKTPAVAEIRGLEYRWIDLGVHPLQQRQYFHASPPQRPAGEIDAAYVDRIVVIREQ